MGNSRIDGLSEDYDDERSVDTVTKSRKSSYLPKVVYKNKDFDVFFKVLLVGDMGVGKSSFLLRLTECVFNAAHCTTIGADFKIHRYLSNGLRCKIQYWDTAGQERFRTITNSFYRGAHSVLIMFDLTKKASFDHIKLCLECVETLSDDFCQVLLVGNKVDLIHRRVVCDEEISNLMKINPRIISYVQTSAKDNTNIDMTNKKMVDILIGTFVEKKIADEILNSKLIFKPPKSDPYEYKTKKGERINKKLKKEEELEGEEEEEEEEDPKEEKEEVVGVTNFREAILESKKRNPTQVIIRTPNSNRPISIEAIAEENSLLFFRGRNTRIIGKEDLKKIICFKEALQVGIDFRSHQGDNPKSAFTILQFFQESDFSNFTNELSMIYGENMVVYRRFDTPSDMSINRLSELYKIPVENSLVRIIADLEKEKNEELVLRNYALDEIHKVVFESLRWNSFISKIDLSRCNMNNTIMVCFCENFKYNQFLRELRADGTRDNLSKITWVGAMKLSQWIAKNKVIEKITLRYTMIGNNGAMCLLKSITQAEKLLEMDLSANELEDEISSDLMYIIDFEKELSIRSIILEGNHLTSNFTNSIRKAKNFRNKKFGLRLYGNPCYEYLKDTDEILVLSEREIEEKLVGSADDYQKKLKIPFDQLRISKFPVGIGLEGVVYKCMWNGSLCAVKKIMMNSRETMSEITKEALILSKLSHPNIIQFYGVSISNKCAFIVQEYVERDLSKLLHETNTRITFPQKMRIIIQILSAMIYLQTMKVCHLDIKPSNILIDEKYRIKIIDFGFSESSEFSLSSRNLKKPKGSKYYCSPEVLLNEEAVVRKSDVFSIGIVMFEILFQKKPFLEYQFKSLEEACNEISKDEKVRPLFLENLSVEEKILKPLIIKCWSKNDKERPVFVEVLKFIEKNFQNFVSPDFQ